MRMAGSSPEIPLPARPRRLRRQRLLCLGFLPLLAVPLLLVSGPFAPVDRAAPVALRSVPGASSRTTSSAAPLADVAALRRRTTTTAAAPATTVASTTTVAPQVRSAARPAPTTPPTTAPAAPVTTAAPAAAPPAPAGASVAATPPATAPRPAPTTTVPRPTTTTTTTTTTAPPAPSPHRQSGQATWYRWRRGNCAHNSLPMGTRVTVTAVATGRSTTCVVGDRGGFRSPTIIDLDASVFEQIAPLGAGRIAVVISW